MTYEIIEGDCLDIMRGMADGSVDLVFTDPPYNVGIGSMSWDTIADYDAWCRAWFTEACRIAHTVAFTPGTPNLHLWMNIAEPTHILCHLKANGHQQNQVGFIHWEPVIVYGARRGRRSTNVLRAPILYEPSAEPHPCPKPVALAEQAIRLLAPEGALVLDPFLGSGTTGVAALNTGRHFIGIENHPPYAEIARRRLTDAAAQPRLELIA